MPRKVGTSFVVRHDQMERLEESDGSMSQVVRDALDEYNGNSIPISELEELRDTWRNGEGEANTTGQFDCSDELNELIEEYDE